MSTRLISTSALLLLTFSALAGLTAQAAISSPYPVRAAGWGSIGTNQRFVSRWANDWTDQPSSKPVIFTSETRLRYDSYDNAQLTSDDYTQGLFRGNVGADVRLHPLIRAYGEMGFGSVVGRRQAASSNFHNEGSLQQLFLDLRTPVGPDLVGLMAGRQEFSDGPRQLISVSDGPNLHRTWNGVRLYAHGRRLRLGAFDLRATRLARGVFDETVNRAERLQGLTGSVVISPLGEEPSIFVDPFWFHTENPSFRSGGRTGLDQRDTYGVRVWGKQGNVAFDWTVASQRGHFLDRRVEAWGLFGSHYVTLSTKGWTPRVGARLDVASGGNSYGSGTLKSFNQLHASSGYLGEALFLSNSNLIMVTPGISASPTRATTLSLEYGFARRFSDSDAIYAGLMRSYTGTQNAPGHTIGGLFRFGATWALCDRVILFANFEHLAAGDALRRSQLRSGSYSQIGATFSF